MNLLGSWEKYNYATQQNLSWLANTAVKTNDIIEKQETICIRIRVIEKIVGVTEIIVNMRHQIVAMTHEIVGLRGHL